MQIDDDMLMAYADGDLPFMEAKRIEAAMAQDPILAARVARFRAVRRALRIAYDDVIKEPVPDHLRALIGDLATNEPVGAPSPPQTQMPVTNAARWWLIGMVAAGGLVIGFLMGQIV